MATYRDTGGVYDPYFETYLHEGQVRQYRDSFVARDKALAELQKQKQTEAVDNATNSDTTRSDAKDPTGTSEERAQKHTQQTNPQQQQSGPKTQQEYVEELKKQANPKRKEMSKGEKLVHDMEEQAKYEGRQSSRDKQMEKLGRKGSITGLGVLGAVADGFFTYQGERAEDPNGSKAIDLMKAGAIAGAWLVAEPIMWGITLGGMAKAGAGLLIDDAQENYDIAKSAALHISKDESGSSKGTLGGEMVDSEYAATSRQRQEQIMRNHKISTESILGSEARQLHR